MIGDHPSDIVRSVCVLVSPFVMMFGFYVIAHGHYVPGGGFAGGVALAVSVVLLRLVLPPEELTRFPERLGLYLSVVGLLLYVAVGVVPLAFGAEFLDYAAVENSTITPADLRYLGILIVEIAVGVTVSGALLVIFDVLIGPPDDEPVASDEERT